MLNQPTKDKLHRLKLDAMATAWEQQQQDAAACTLSFDERLAMLVDTEWTARENKRLINALKDAKLRIGGACLEDVEYSARRELDRAQVRQLSTCNWVEEHHNVIIAGPTGVGKTFLACALGQQACRKGFKVLYRRAPRILDELTLAHADGTYIKLLAKLGRVDVLILDDWGLSTLRDQDRHDLLEILDDRQACRSTIITSQLPVNLWHDYVGDPTRADAICERLIHNAHRLVLKGPSRRKDEKPTE